MVRRYLSYYQGVSLIDLLDTMYYEFNTYIVLLKQKYFFSIRYIIMKTIHPSCTRMYMLLLGSPTKILAAFGFTKL